MPQNERLDDNHPVLAALQALQSAIGTLQLKHFTLAQPVQWHALGVAYEAVKLAWCAVRSGYARPDDLQAALADYKRAMSEFRI